MILLALALQAANLYDGLFSTGSMRFSFSLALSLMLWLAVLMYWLESFRSRMDGLQALVLPVAAFHEFCRANHVIQIAPLEGAALPGGAPPDSGSST